MDGILVINKPSGITSRDVVNRVSKILNMSKIGHTGTLDPLATGVLILCLGKATKLVELITCETKEYIASIELGIETDTYDVTGKIINTSNLRPNFAELKNCLNSFIGDYWQEVPKYSAIKINGHKLYEYARQNIEIELPKRLVTIKALELIDYHDNEITFKTTVSKGTYIRSLIRDICLNLNTLGSMSSLVRTKQGDYTLDQSNSLEDIEKNSYHIITIEEALTKYEHIEITTEQMIKIKNGCILDRFFKDEKCVITYQKSIVAIYQTYSKDNTKVKPYQMFI